MNAPRMLVSLLWMVSSGFAQGMWGIEKGFDPTFGIELTFTNGYLIKKGKSEGINHDGSSANKKARNQWGKTIRKICEERMGSERCVVESSERRHYTIYTVRYPADNWYYNVTVDPLVVEVTAKPMTLDELQHFAYRIHNDIFSFAANVLKVGPWYKRGAGLKPSPTVGGGHIHIGFQSSFA